MSPFDRLHDVIGAFRAKQLFFVGGSMKSGTTWLQLLLDAHPRVACKGEGHVMNHLALLLDGSLKAHNRKIDNKNHVVFGGLEGFPLYSANDLAYLIGSAVLLALAKTGVTDDVRAIGEKTPDNVRYFEVLSTIFPRAKFLNVVRDGRDCAVSGWFHNLRTGSDAFLAAYPTLTDYTTMFAREWANDIACAERFAQTRPRTCLTVRYEALLADTDAILRDVLDFLDVPSTDEEVVRCTGAARFERLTQGRPRGQEDRRSFFRQGQEGNWREHLDEAGSRAFAAGVVLGRRSQSVVDPPALTPHPPSDGVIRCDCPGGRGGGVDVRDPSGAARTASAGAGSCGSGGGEDPDLGRRAVQFHQYRHRAGAVPVG